MIDVNTIVADLLMEWEEHSSSGKPARPEDLCRDHPECIPELRRRIELLGRVETLVTLAPLTENEPPNFPGFEILGKLGDGGMGSVYHALEVALDRFVAIKIPHRPMASSKHFRARFEREAKFLAQLRHPHIVPIYRADTIHGVPYFVMEYESGGTLAQRRDEFAPHPARAAQIVEKVTRAVAYAHEHGVRHRDLKPANIFLSHEGEPLVGDFGVATLVEADAPVRSSEPAVGTPASQAATATKPLTRAGTTLGTPAYMAPEQLAPVAQDVDDRADVWALGVILYELLTGHLPYDAKDPQAMYEEITQAPAPSPRRLNRRVDRGLDAIVRRCLQKDPNQRFPTAKALADRLARWAKWRSRLRWRWAAAAGIIGILLVTSAMLPWSRNLVQTVIFRAKTNDAISRLERGETVELIGDSGAPAAFRFRAGEAFTTASSSLTYAPKTGDHFMLKTERAALVEFLPDVPLDRFRASVEFQTDMAFASEAFIGIYFSENVYNTSRGENHLFRAALVQVADNMEPKERFMKARTWLMVYNEDPQPTGRSHSMTGPLVKCPAPRESEKTWQRLVLDVTPEAFSGQLEGSRIKPLRDDRYRPTIIQELPDRFPDLQGMPIFEGHRGGFGLYVNHASAWIRNFRIEPLPEQNTQTQEAP